MTPATSFAERKVALFGLGGSGLATALALKAGGADVTAWDDAAASRAKAEAQGIPVADLHEVDWSLFSALILSPGVPLTHPAPHWTAALARQAGIEVIGDIELFCRERMRLAPGAPFIAITGTNGKSTTTALIAHVLREAGRDVQMGGNIGTPILALEPPSAERVHVIEMSSFQIDLTPSLDPSVGLMLNLSPDHLDRHGTMEHYAAIKERLVAQSDAALVGIDDPLSKAMASRLEGRGTRETYPVSAEHALGSGFFAEGSRIRARAVGQGNQDLDFGDLAGIGSLRGRHNAQNAAFAAASAWLCGVSPQQIASAFKTFPGLPHRMEEVGRIDRVLFVNDSKATNADSTEKALTSFEHVFWILGGKQKEGGIASLAPYFGRITRAYLIGEAADAFAATLEGHVAYTHCGTLDRAVAAAAGDAARASVSEPVVLLSPACASYDQFPNFGVRGDHFRDLVRALPGFSPTIPASGPVHGTASEPTLAKSPAISSTAP